MPSLKLKHNLLLSLFILAVILIGLKILFNNFLIQSDHEERFVDVAEISKRFNSLLDDRGIDEKLITINKSRDKYSGHEIPNIKIEVPRDLSIPELILDIYQSFTKDSLLIYSEEKVKGGKSVLALKKDKSIILEAELDYSKNVFRNKGSMAFILKDVELESSSIADLIESSSKLNFLIRPDTKLVQHIDLITLNGKQFSILIDDEIVEQKYKLGPGHSNQRVITVVKSLVTDFAKATFFIIDNKSEFYNSFNREVFSRELSKRNIRLLTFSDFLNIDKDENLFDDFKLYTENLTAKEGRIFLLSEDSYIEINPEIRKCKKRGYKVVNSSLILY